MRYYHNPKIIPKRDSERREQTYFNVSPGGDWQTGSSVFAAKHLQSDYVKSIPFPGKFDPYKYFGDEDNDDNLEILHQIYNKGALP